MGILFLIATYLLFWALDFSLGVGGMNIAVAPFVIPAITAGIGALGQLFGGGGGGQRQSQIQEIIRRLSPEQQGFLEQLQGELGRDAFDVSGITGAARERIGNESSALRIAAMQRLQRGGASASQTESSLQDITTIGLRELGSTTANIEFAGQQAEEGRRLDIFRQMAGILSGTGSSSQAGTATSTAQSGFGFAQLFGTGLAGLFDTVGGGNKPKSKGQTFFNPQLQT